MCMTLLFKDILGGKFTTPESLEINVCLFFPKTVGASPLVSVPFVDKVFYMCSLTMLIEIFFSIT